MSESHHASALQSHASILELAHLHRSDKAEHGYCAFYEELFSGRRLEPLKILELGVGGFEKQDDPNFGGASLRIWKDYFPSAEICGVDLLDKSGIAADRIRIFQGSQTDESLLHKLHREHGPFDIIVDDASHIPALTNQSFAILFPLLAPNGIYVIEDLSTSYWPMWGGRFHRHARRTTMALVKDRLDGLNHAEFKIPRYQASELDTSILEIRSRHNIVAFLKGANTIPSDLNRPNPVSVGEWVRGDLLPVVVVAARTPIVNRCLDTIGLRGVARRLRRSIAPNIER